MSKFLIPIVIIIILAALVVSVYAGVSLVTMIYEDEEFFLPDIPELKTGLPNDSNLDDIKIEKKVEPTNKLQSESTSKIDFHIKKSIHSDQASIMVTGIIVNPIFSGKTSVDVYDVDTGERVKNFDYPSSSFVMSDGLFSMGFGFSGDYFDGSYKIVISHNGVNASKIFIVERSEHIVG